MLKRWLAAITILAFASSTTFAQEPRVDIGLMTCGLDESAEVETSSDAVPLEARKMLCVFRPSNSWPEEVYVGAFQTIGGAQDPAQNNAMIWIVKASPATQRTTGVLQQLYSADRLTQSMHPPPLIGETNSSIVLQNLADTLPINRANKESNAVGIIVLVVLKLLSSPA